MAFYILGLFIVLLIKTLVHNRSDSEIEWVNRALEVPADATILAFMMVVAHSAASNDSSRSHYVLLAVGAAILSVFLYKYSFKLTSFNSGQISFDSFSKFISAFLGNVFIAIASIYLVYSLGVF